MNIVTGRPYYYYYLLLFRYCFFGEEMNGYCANGWLGNNVKMDIYSVDMSCQIPN